MPASISTTNSSTSLSAMACSTWTRMALLSGSVEPGTRPPVSTSQNLRPFHSAGAKCRSRVTPGCASTIAWRRPMMRLNSVDLPTFGRPMIATVGTVIAGSGSHPEGFSCGDFLTHQRIGEVIRELDRHWQLSRQLMRFHVIHEKQIVVDRLGGQQRKIEIATVAQSLQYCFARQQARGSHRRAEQRILEREDFEPSAGGTLELTHDLRHKRSHRHARDDPDALPPPGPRPQAPGPASNPRLEITDCSNPVLSLLEVTVPFRGRQRHVGLEVEVVGSVGPRHAPLGHSLRGEPVP